MSFYRILLGCLWLLIPLFSFAADNHLIKKQRIIFQQANKALQTHKVNEFQRLKKQLDDYPLQAYLDYLYLRHRLNPSNNDAIIQFLYQHQNTFYAARLRSAWLDRLAQQKQWQTFLDHYQEPQSVSRQCTRLKALINTGNTEQVLAETLPLWLVPKSQHNACNTAFKYWQSQGRLTDELRWQRIKLALQESQFNLATYLSKSLSEPNEAQAWIARWKKIHHHPHSLLKQLPGKPLSIPTPSLFNDVPLSREIIKHGIERLARKSTDQAYEAWQRISPAYQFNDQDKLSTQRYIANRAALNREDRTLEFFADIPDEPWRVRAALWQQDWPAVQKAILSLSIDEQQTNRWQYWLGRSQAELGDTLAANNTYQTLISERDYYSFLAADKLGQPYQMNHNPIQYEQLEMDNFTRKPAVARLKEFYALNMKSEAHRQAYALKIKLPPRELQLLATLTHQWGWHNQTIFLLGKAQYWDALNLRFPIIYDTPILKASKTNGLDPSWLFGIARQESAFNPQARSPVGATGLMQLMPNTGKLIARLINQPLKTTTELLNPNRNIQLGSAYLRRMYDKNQHNPVLATASYNAGPHRVARWLPKQTLAADIWIENIPFNETRKYTSNVLSYAAIFDYQRKQTILPLSKRMPVVKPKKP